MKYLHIALFLAVALVAPEYVIGVEAEPAVKSQEVQENLKPRDEELFKKPKPNEPIFPMEDLIAKPLKNNDRLFTDIINMMTTLGLIIGGILIVAWFLKKLVNTRIEQMNENSLIHIVERRTLSPKSMVYIIEVDDRRIILAESSQGVTRVADYPAPKE